MDIRIENCRNIGKATISIVPNSLNVKFAPNGTGKTSLACGIVRAVGRHDINDDSYVPFKYLQAGTKDDHPFNATGLEDVAVVKVFDEAFVSDVVFHESQIYQNGYEAFIKSDDLLATEKSLKERLSALVVLSESEVSQELKRDLGAFANDFYGRNLTKSRQVKETSPVIKALKDGNAWDNPSVELEPFGGLLASSEFKSWITWHGKGASFRSVLSDRCPYCGQSLEEHNASIRAVEEGFSSAKAGNIEKVLNAVKTIERYLSDDAADQLASIVGSPSALTSMQKNYISKIAIDASSILHAVEQLSTVYSYFDLAACVDLEERLNECRIDMDKVDSFNSIICQQYASEVTNAVDEALNEVRALNGLIIQQKNWLARSIESRRREINDFLRNAGYPYRIDIGVNAENSCSVELIHECEWPVSDSDKALSYGEKNALALVFFMYDALKDGADLIILDDPISSFDGQKRFAILNMLFINGKAGISNLKNRTVLLLTHDYQMLYDIENHHKQSLQPMAQSAILNMKDGVLSEKVVCADDMVYTPTLYLRLANESNSTITRLVYARKLLELNERTRNVDCDIAYAIVSSLFHHRQVPIDNCNNVIEGAELGIGLRILEHMIDRKVDYQSLHSQLEDADKMLSYLEDADCNYEVLQLARIALDQEYDNKVFRDRMNESVHVGNGYMYQLDPREFELCPDYIAAECKAALANKVKSQLCLE